MARITHGDVEWVDRERDARVRGVLRQARMEQGVTVLEVSRRVGISRPFYTQLEGGSRRLSVVYFFAICRALRVDPVQVVALAKGESDV